MSNNWQTLKIGAGGWLTGIDIAPDDTMVVRTDTYGAYIWNGSTWQQLVTATSMPASASGETTSAKGVYEIQIAPSNSNILYMSYLGDVYVSSDKGGHWTKTAFAHVTENPNDSGKTIGQKMAIDPNDPNVVYVGTPQDGLFVTRDGGATWKAITDVPVGLPDFKGDQVGITGIEVDPANSNVVFASSYGNGVYESTDAGATWSKLSGGPSNVEYAAISKAGVYYAVGDNNTDLWRYSNGTWTELLSPSQAPKGVHTVAVDPFNPDRIVVDTPLGTLNESLDGGATWVGWHPNIQLNSPAIPWLASAVSGMAIGGMVFDQLIPNKLWASDGVGAWEADLAQGLTPNTPFVWNSQSVGIEQLVSNEIIVPPGGKPILAGWDFGFFYVANPDAYQTTHAPNAGGAICSGWSLDYASSDPSFVVGIADNWGVEESGYSTNGGQSWTVFPSMPSFVGQAIGGTIAASSPTDIVWAPAGGFDPSYTLDGGVTWKPVVLPGISNWSAFDTAYYYDTRTVTADRVLPNTFYLYYAGQGVFESTDGGSTWAKVYSGNISPSSNFNAELESVPGEAGNLFFTGGPQNNLPSEGFYQSNDQGAHWTAVSNVTEVSCFGFGAPAPGQSYPAIYIVGYVNHIYGVWQSNDDAKNWTQIGTYPTGSLDNIKTISGDPNIYGQVYVGFGGSGYAYLAAAPAVSISSASSVSGTVSDGITNATKLTLTGIAPLDSTVNIYDGAKLLGTTTSNSSGAWSLSTGTLADGTHSFSATAIVSGVATAASAALNVTVDTVAPALTESLVNDTGSSSTDHITSISKIAGVGDPNAVVHFTIDGTPIVGTAMADSKGIWTFTPTGLSDGTHKIVASETDAAGNTASASLTFTLDTKAPVVTESLVNDTGSSSTDKITSIDTLTGTGNPDVVVHFTADGKLLPGTAVSNSSGVWTFTPTSLTDGTHTIVASETDLAGNTGTASLTFTLDHTLPVTTIANIVQQQANNLSTTTISGASEPGSSVTLYEGTTALATTVVAATGQWSISLNDLSNAVHNFTAGATDVAGNKGSLSQVAILGTKGNDNIVATGSDTIFGNGGNDNFTAGSGNDNFVFKPGFGKDTISSFDVNHDALTFDHTLFANVPSILSHTVDVNGSAVITFDSGNSVDLHGITTAQLTAHQGDFHII